MDLSDKALGTFRSVRTRDAVARDRDCWQYFAMNRLGLDSSGEALYEIRFADGQWILAVAGDLQSYESPEA
ncbi:hypothetical protein [Arthrobacter sp. lap29]|uniref:hypothetical protein n=1 Tax=Arthrobacter sp. lap29 TaxID=3056122 RepID=UPI0028F6EDB1|nr:hypothetical protein [Arthrobacter sp. lap29]